MRISVVYFAIFLSVLEKLTLPPNLIRPMIDNIFHLDHRTESAIKQGIEAFTHCEEVDSRKILT